MKLEWHAREDVPSGPKAGTFFTDPMFLQLKDGSFALGHALMQSCGTRVHSWSFIPDSKLLGKSCHSESCFHGDLDVVKWAWAPDVNELLLESMQ